MVLLLASASEALAVTPMKVSTAVFSGTVLGAIPTSMDSTSNTGVVTWNSFTSLMLTTKVWKVERPSASVLRTTTLYADRNSALRGTPAFSCSVGSPPTDAIWK